MALRPQTAPSLKYEAFQDRENPSDWRVEAIDVKAGDVYIAIFMAPGARDRAIEYAEFKNRERI